MSCVAWTTKRSPVAYSLAEGLKDGEAEKGWERKSDDFVGGESALGYDTL